MRSGAMSPDGLFVIRDLSAIWSLAGHHRLFAPQKTASFFSPITADRVVVRRGL
jgi:hypothetical protein